MAFDRTTRVTEQEVDAAAAAMKGVAREEVVAVEAVAAIAMTDKTVPVNRKHHSHPEMLVPPRKLTFHVESTPSKLTKAGEHLPAMQSGPMRKRVKPSLQAK